MTPVSFNMFKKPFNRNKSIVARDGFLTFVLAQVETHYDRKDRKRAIVFEKGCVLCCIDVEEAVSLVGIDSQSRNVQVCSLFQVFNTGRDKLRKSEQSDSV